MKPLSLVISTLSSFATRLNIQKVERSVSAPDPNEPQATVSPTASLQVIAVKRVKSWTAKQ